MNTQPKVTDEQLSWEDLETLPLEELEKLFLHMYSALEKTFHTISGYAQRVTDTESQQISALELENQYKGIWAELKTTVYAIICHAIFSEQNEEEFCSQAVKV